MIVWLGYLDRIEYRLQEKLINTKKGKGGNFTILVKFLDFTGSSNLMKKEGYLKLYTKAGMVLSGHLRSLSFNIIVKDSPGLISRRTYKQL